MLLRVSINRSPSTIQIAFLLFCVLTHSHWLSDVLHAQGTFQLQLSSSFIPIIINFLLNIIVNWFDYSSHVHSDSSSTQMISINNYCKANFTFLLLTWEVFSWTCCSKQKYKTFLPTARKVWDWKKFFLLCTYGWTVCINNVFHIFFIHS